MLTSYLLDQIFFADNSARYPLYKRIVSSFPAFDNFREEFADDDDYDDDEDLIGTDEESSQAFKEFQETLSKSTLFRGVTTSVQPSSSVTKETPEEAQSEKNDIDDLEMLEMMEKLTLFEQQELFDEENQDDSKWRR